MRLLEFQPNTRDCRNNSRGTSMGNVLVDPVTPAHSLWRNAWILVVRALTLVGWVVVTAVAFWIASIVSPTG